MTFTTSIEQTKAEKQEETKALTELRRRYPNVPQRTFARAVYCSDGYLLGKYNSERDRDLLWDADTGFAPLATIYGRVRKIDAELFGKDNRGVRRAEVTCA